MNRIEARFRLTLPAFTLDATFETPAHGVIGVFGPSGSGKTTLLRCIAGLLRADDARLAINGDCWQDETQRHFVAPHQRAIGYVFQEANLFAHLSVARNLVYGCKRVPAAQRRIDPEQAIEWLGLRTLLARYPQHLSGGERQRVAIARALLTSPKLLLLDEPLSAVDENSKAEILSYLERLQRELSIPTFYVSHSIDEIARLADYLILMERGRVQAHGALRPLLTQLDLPLAHADSSGAVIEATVSAHDDAFHLTLLDFNGGRLTVGKITAAPGALVRVRVQARDVSLALTPPQQTSILNVLPARVVALAEEAAGRVVVQLQIGSTLLLARITKKSATLLELQPGMPVYAQIKSVALLR